MIPKEHGAWAVLLVPMIVAVGIAADFSIEGLLLALSALAVFMSYVPVHTILRHVFVMPQSKTRLAESAWWGGIYLTAGIALMVPLLVQGFRLLLVIGCVGLIGFFGNFFLTRRYPKTIPSDLLAVFSLTLGAPAMYYVLTGLLDSTAVLLWVLNFLFFGCSVFYVHMKIRAASSKRKDFAMHEKMSLGKLTVLYHIAVLAIVAILAANRYTTAFAVIAFVPMTLHALYGTFKLSGSVRFKNLGFLLLAQSVFFGALLMLAGSGGVR